ncbi:MAG: site-specific integrase [Clostridiales bacterium]|nr:site-specific integrase [Clostridiales bacterium]
MKRWMEEWKRDWLLQVKETTVRRYDMELQLRIIPRLGKFDLDAVTAEQVQRFYNSLSRDGLSAKSVKCTHGVLHEAFDKAVKLGLLTENITDKCVLPKQAIPEMRPFKNDEIAVFLEKIKGHRYENAYYVALFTGMREAEIMGLTWDCIDFESGTIHIYRQLQRTLIKGKYSFTKPKNSKSRTIKPATEIMNRLKAIDIKDSEFVFTDRNGVHLTINMLYKPFKKIVDSMGLGSMRFHDLRHTYAVLSLQGGCDIKTLSANLGHAAVAFTLDRYGHVSQEMHVKSSETMQRVIDSFSNGCKRNET